MMNMETQAAASQSLHFKTSGKAGKYHAAYEKSLDQWKIPYASSYVPTRFGATHVISCGPIEGKPLVVLHAMGFSSTIWQPNIEVLAHSHRVYAVDYIGDLNKSVPETLPASREDCIIWLDEVLDRLQVEKCCLGGISYGGFLAMNYGMHAPEKIEKLFLVSPAASFVPLHQAFITRIISMAAVPMKWNVMRFIRWLSQHDLNKALVDQFHAAFRYGSMSLKVPPSVYTDEELNQLTMPILLLLGDQEVISDGQQAFKRAGTLGAEWDVEMIAGVGHLLNLENPEYVNKRIGQFLART